MKMINIKGFYIVLLWLGFVGFWMLLMYLRQNHLIDYIGLWVAIAFLLVLISSLLWSYKRHKIFFGVLLLLITLMLVTIFKIDTFFETVNEQTETQKERAIERQIEYQECLKKNPDNPINCPIGGSAY